MMRALALLGLAAAALAASPAQARMSHSVLFGTDLLPNDLDGGIGGVGGFSVQHMADPAGALFERMFRDFSAAPERLPRARPRNDIEATLDAMQDARVGFSGDARASGNNARRRSRASTPRG
jgi:hypothetical protein